MDSIQEIVESLAERLGRPVMISDSRNRSLAFSEQTDGIDKFRIEAIVRFRPLPEMMDYIDRAGVEDPDDIVWVPPNPQMQSLSRTRVSVRRNGILLGYIWLINTPQHITNRERTAIYESREIVGKFLLRNQVYRMRDEESIIQDLLSDDLFSRESAIRTISAKLSGIPKIYARSVAIACTADISDPTTIEATIRRAAHKSNSITTFSCTRGSSTWMTLLISKHETSLQDALSSCGAVRREVSREYSKVGHGLRLGIGPSISDLHRLPENYEYALDALRIGRASPGSKSVVAWEELGAYKFLAQIPNGKLQETGICSGLSRLLASDANGTLFRTLEVYLDSAGHVSTASARLRIHRASLYYRLKKIEEISHMDLSSGDDRLTLHIGVRLVHLREPAQIIDPE